MISSLTTQLIEGALELVQTIKYSNGNTVRRVLDKVSGIPTRILPAK